MQRVLQICCGQGSAHKYNLNSDEKQKQKKHKNKIDYNKTCMEEMAPIRLVDGHRFVHEVAPGWADTVGVL